MAYDAARVGAIVGANTSDSEKLAIIIDLLQTAGIITTPAAGGATAANQATELAALGAATDAAVTNPASSASIIAAIKGLLSLIGTKAAGTAAAVSALVGAVYNSTKVTLTNGQQAAISLDSRGSQHTVLFGVDTAIGVPVLANGADAVSNTALNALQTYSFGAVWNGTTWDRMPGTTAGVGTKEKRAATGTETNVAGSATDVTILASNASRLGASVFNDSAAILYLLLSNATSSATVHTIQMAPGSYYDDFPAGYTGIVKGLWASATGSARVTEYT